MTGAEFRGNDPFDQWLPDHFLASPAEDSLGRWVPIDDDSGGVHDQHGVKRRIDDRAAAYLTLTKCLGSGARMGFLAGDRPAGGRTP